MGFGFFGEDLLETELPHPTISLAIFLVVEEAVRAAWESLRTHPRSGFDILNATEDVVTHELYERLFDTIFNKGIVEGFDRQLFTVVTRESKVRNYDGSMLDKMPDLLIGLSDRLNVYKPTQDWIFIECKPADLEHPVGVHYCDKGIVRFVRGEYAWAMTSALMIAYARSGFTISGKLDSALQERKKQLPTTAFPLPCRRSTPSPNSEVVHISRHSRIFRYVETGRQAPEITIRHLWLRRD